MRTLLIAAAAMLATTAAAQQATTTTTADHAQAGAGRTQMEAACSGCHALDVVTSQHYPPAKWDEVVKDMVGRGAPLDDADQPAVIAYLARTQGTAK